MHPPPLPEVGDVTYLTPSRRPRPKRALCGSHAATSTANRTHTQAMSRKSSSHEDGMQGVGRDKRSTKAGKARRSFELNGQYSAKHLRLKELSREQQAQQAK